MSYSGVHPSINDNESNLLKKVAENTALIVDQGPGGGGGGGGGDASAANQLTQIGLETSIVSNTGPLGDVFYTGAAVSSGPPANNNALNGGASVDTAGYAFAYLTAVATGAVNSIPIKIEHSPDNANWYPLNVTTVASGNGAGTAPLYNNYPQINGGFVAVYFVPLASRYLRVNYGAGSFGGGTIQIYTRLTKVAGNIFSLVNNAMVGGSAISTNDGTTDQGTQRVTLGSIGSANGSVLQTAYALPVRAAPQLVWRTTFAQVVASGVDTSFWTLLQTGSGHTIAQSGGNLVLTAGTTANAESVIRSNVYWQEAFNLRFGSNLSQRIVNNNFYVELVDVIGDGLSYTIGSATAVTVTIPSNPFTSANVGQSMFIGVITGAAGIPMKGTIASVSGNNVTFTVAGWPASGSGTCSLFGWNYHHVLFTGATATNANYDGQRNGWATGDTVATINTTAAPGTVIQVTNDAGISTMSDSLAASTTTPSFVTRASRYQNLPANDIKLYLQIRSTNGTTNPASNTTWTVNFVAMEDFASQPVSICASKLMGAASSPVTIANTPAVTITSGTVTTVTTVTTCSTVTTLANGQTAHSAASTGSPVRVGGRVVTTLDTTLVQGDASDLAVTSGQQLVCKDFATSENDWQYATPIASPITGTSATALKAAGAANIRNFVTGLQYINTAAVASIVTLQDGATVVWTGYMPASMTSLFTITFPTPIRGSAATAMNFVINTTSTNTFVSAQGYQSF